MARERFRLEARAIASLDHPNVCTIYDMGDAGDERFFIAMPFYEGETIAASLSRGPLAIDETISFGRQIARGLAAAHARGIIHRDIKPANLIVTASNVVKILDVRDAHGRASVSRNGRARGGRCDLHCRAGGDHRVARGCA
ncbi:MAG: protein kinase [Gemmatimonadota bacterium]|nr:protein kinase [Gemmatimonadota bacterium]